jgi:hypothetical protein
MQCVFEGRMKDMRGTPPVIPDRMEREFRKHLEGQFEPVYRLERRPRRSMMTPRSHDLFLRRQHRAVVSATVA